MDIDDYYICNDDVRDLQLIDSESFRFHNDNDNDNDNKGNDSD